MHRSASAVVLVAAALVLAGCSAVAPTTPTPTAAGGDATDAAIPDGAATLPATVTRVVDGDTVAVRAGGETDTVRLVGVDAPETRGETYPAEFEGVPGTAAGRACLSRAADDATAALADLVADRDVTLAVDPLTDRRGPYDRLLAYVVVDGTNANHRLVDAGRARVYDTEFALADRFYESERTARDERRGLWACADEPTGDTGLQLRVRADAPGDDRENPTASTSNSSRATTQSTSAAGPSPTRLAASSPSPREPPCPRTAACGSTPAPARTPPPSSTGVRAPSGTMTATPPPCGTRTEISCWNTRTSFSLSRFCYCGREQPESPGGLRSRGSLRASSLTSVHSFQCLLHRETEGLPSTRREAPRTPGFA